MARRGIDLELNRHDTRGLGLPVGLNNGATEKDLEVVLDFGVDGRGTCNHEAHATT